MSAPQLPSQGAELDRATALFLAERTHLFWVAYRIVGDVGSSEDLVQETWLRWQRADHGRIDNPAAFLAAATTRLAINLIQSARHRRETPIGVPQAGPVDTSQDPATQAEQSAAVERALELLIARLTPSERAVYLLRKGFDYPYRDIAQLLHTSVPNARQLARRAQQNLAIRLDRRVPRDAHRQLVQAFLRATQTGDLAELQHLLAEDRFRRRAGWRRLPVPDVA